MSGLIGEIPASWVTAQLSDICTLTPGASTPSDSDAGSIPVLKPKNVIDGKLAGPVDGISAEEAARRPRYWVRSGDILCVRTGSVGRTGLATADQEGWIFGTGLICLRPFDGVDPQFLYFYLTHPAVTGWLTSHAQGSTAISSISARVLGTLPVSVPPLPTQRDIGRALATLNDKIEAHQRICRTTAELRDALLPLLLTGRLSASGGNEAPSRDPINLG
jgi:restriction endonuclease S subunit